MDYQFLYVDVTGGPYNLLYIDSSGDGSVDWVLNLYYNKSAQGHNYVPIFRLIIANSSTVPVSLRNPNALIPWPGNRTLPPTGEPPCGWDGCPVFFRGMFI